MMLKQAKLMRFGVDFRNRWGLDVNMNTAMILFMWWTPKMMDFLNNWKYFNYEVNFL